MVYCCSICGNEELLKDILYTLASIPSNLFHFHPTSLDKEKTSALKLPSFSILRTILTTTMGPDGLYLLRL